MGIKIPTECLSSCSELPFTAPQGSSSTSSSPLSSSVLGNQKDTRQQVRQKQLYFSLFVGQEMLSLHSELSDPCWSPTM